jgi:hypothetical protein
MSDEWTDEERAAIGRLERSAESKDLEERTVEALRDRGLLQPRRRNGWRPAVAAAAAIILFGAGIIAGRLSLSPASRPVGGRYLLLLHESGSPPASATVVAGQVEDHRKWAMTMRAGNRLEDGEKLVDRGLLVSAAGVTEISGADLEGHAGGFFIVYADSLQEAEAIARSSPHLRHGGVVEVRPIEEL